MCVAGHRSVRGAHAKCDRAKLAPKREARMIRSKCSAAILAVILLLSRTVYAEPGHLPEIITGPTNVVPACVTPSNLMAFVTNRNHKLKPAKEIDNRFSDIAVFYKAIGECVKKSDDECIGIRWDFAFFQMLVETNYLTFTGGVRPDDNNFAGIGATVAGKPGEVFQSVQDGVLAHLQHVLMYSGNRIANPIAQRTKLVQDVVLKKMSALGRPVTYADLTNMWVGGDRSAYAAAISDTSTAFWRQFCTTAQRPR